jgi:hypothetical protein
MAAPLAVRTVESLLNRYIISVDVDNCGFIGRIVVGTSNNGPTPGLIVGRSQDARALSLNRIVGILRNWPWLPWQHSAKEHAQRGRLDRAHMVHTCFPKVQCFDLLLVLVLGRMKLRDGVTQCVHDKRSPV